MILPAPAPLSASLGRLHVRAVVRACQWLCVRAWVFCARACVGVLACACVRVRAWERACVRVRSRAWMRPIPLSPLLALCFSILL